MKSRYFLVLFTLSFIPFLLNSQLLVSEVYPNPLGTEPYGEWIEIYNASDTAVCIDGWTIDDDEGVWTIPDPTTGVEDYLIIPGGFLTFANDADTFFSVYGYYPDFARQGSNAITIIESGTVYLANSGDQVYLRDTMGTIIDAVQWGTTYEEDSIYYPINAPSEGESALRVPYNAEGTEAEGELSEVLSDVWTYSDDVNVSYEGPNTGGLADAPYISDISRTPYYPTDLDSVKISCVVLGGTPDSLLLFYTVNSSTNMNKMVYDIANDNYYAYIPVYAESTQVSYYAILYASKNDTTDIYSYIVSKGNDIYVYFNKSVDPSVAINETAYGNAPLDSLLCSYIHKAEYSIDVCAYDIDRQIIVDSLIVAFNRGIKVRIITDNDNVTNTAITDMKNAGIPVIDDSFSDTYDGGNIMHNKFVVFDARDTSVLNDWVWTGSYNLTDNGTTYNPNNAIAIHSAGAADIYEDEFNEMWGSDTDTPNSANSRFSTGKTDNTNHIINIGDTQIEIYFSPSDDSRDTLVNRIIGKNTMYFAIFSYTDNVLNDVLLNFWNGNHGDYSNIRGIFDNTYWTSYIYSKAKNMTGYADSYSGTIWSPSIDTIYAVIKDDLHTTFHHKYMILNEGESDATVITGSTNWSGNGFDSNDENMIIIHSTNISNLFYQELSERFKENTGTGLSSNLSIPVKKAKETYSSLFSFYLYALNGELNIYAQDTGNLLIYDIAGRKVYSMNIKKGYQKINSLKKYGIYVYEFKASNGENKTGKFLLVR